MFSFQKALLITAAVIASLFLFGSRAYAYTSTGTVNCTGYLNVRQSSGTRSKIIGKLYPGTQVSITGSSNGWYRISRGSTGGWVSARYVSTHPSLSSRGSTVSKTAGTNKGQQIAECAKSYVGVRYSYGGSMPGGFDCSGLTSYVYGRFGIGLTRRASTQARQGVTVGMSGLKPGDLVFFDTNGGRNDISHVGIYIGGNRFVHAASGPTYRVIVSSLGESYYAARFMLAKRIAI